MYVGVAEHFREHCWIVVGCMGPEMGFLGRVGKPLSKSTRHAEMTSLAGAVGFGKETSGLDHQSDGESSPQPGSSTSFAASPVHHPVPKGQTHHGVSPWGAGVAGPRGLALVFLP